ncbi:VOC family protein [Kribbella turkmenica]|uniref:VOC family protein n=1 Tax=Kribbella turkmenica TaxID=2530375 RepID=A0A4R4W724_9ACTN|nr:VOC family protein [Kribbella turkmenica]TDD14469.1 VOC family protein [Kribbella turkmenica]
MRIHQVSIFVDDQEKALRFYTDVLGFVKRYDVPMGEDRWITVVSPEAPGETELVLEPDRHPVVNAYKAGLAKDGIPAVSFAVDDVQAEYDRLGKIGVLFTQQPLDMGMSVTAVLDDTCGNLVQIVHLK